MIHAKGVRMNIKLIYFIMLIITLQLKSRSCIPNLREDVGSEYLHFEDLNELLQERKQSKRLSADFDHEDKWIFTPQSTEFLYNFIPIYGDTEDELHTSNRKLKDESWGEDLFALSAANRTSELKIVPSDLHLHFPVRKYMFGMPARGAIRRHRLREMKRFARRFLTVLQLTHLLQEMRTRKRSVWNQVTKELAVWLRRDGFKNVWKNQRRTEILSN